MLLYFIQIFPNDSGPIYKETIAGRFPAEPFNTLSNLLFLIIIIYFARKVYKNVKTHRYLAFAIPIIALSFVGGTVYHATRSHEIWLLMDWVPIALLLLSVGIYFIFKLTKTLLGRLLWIVMIFGANFGFRSLPLPESLQISYGYVVSGLSLIAPIIVYLIKTNFVNGKYILAAIGSFALAITFRSLDKSLDMFPMGSHWLWHSFGAIAVFFLMKFIFLDSEKLASNTRTII
ncbi:hypothetical protein [Winogradskyella sp.]|uniref:hypothetical protein n=1 Tax=Winogradskyella sp. TaxID=1883156 RepID=UPI0026176579|nr:hypothetical protein [Winogradskyella sp.]